jgi:hypothetical protein
MIPNHTNTFFASSHGIAGFWDAYLAANRRRVPFFEWMGVIYYIVPVFDQVFSLDHSKFLPTTYTASLIH